MVGQWTVPLDTGTGLGCKELQLPCLHPVLWREEKKQKLLRMLGESQMPPRQIYKSAYFKAENVGEQKCKT